MGFCTIKIPNSVEILEEGGFKIGSQIDTLSLECHNYFRCTARMKTENITFDLLPNPNITIDQNSSLDIY